MSSTCLALFLISDVIISFWVSGLIVLGPAWANFAGDFQL
jgi:hypothetical protein